jgi:hypothetical protein
MQHESGYTFVWKGKGSPFPDNSYGDIRATDSEQWEIECLSARADAHPVGFTRIDGSDCIVFQTTEGGYLAQLCAGRLTPEGPKQPRLFKD